MTAANLKPYSAYRNSGVPLPEQTAIVRFLDHTDRRIRRYIRAKQKLMALLEEQKQALIHQAVTGQINVREAATALPGGDSLAAGDTLNDTLNTEAV